MVPGPTQRRRRRWTGTDPPGEWGPVTFRIPVGDSEYGRQKSQGISESKSTLEGPSGAPCGRKEVAESG